MFYQSYAMKLKAKMIAGIETSGMSSEGIKDDSEDSDNDNVQGAPSLALNPTNSNNNNINNNIVNGIAPISTMSASMTPVSAQSNPNNFIQNTPQIPLSPLSIDEDAPFAGAITARVAAGVRGVGIGSGVDCVRGTHINGSSHSFETEMTSGITGTQTPTLCCNYSTTSRQRISVILLNGSSLIGRTSSVNSTNIIINIPTFAPIVMVHDIGYDIVDKVRKHNYPCTKAIIKIIIIIIAIATSPTLCVVFIFDFNESVIAIFGGLHDTTY